MIDQLLSAHRLVIDAELAPVVGSTFQPTGFPNLGAAEFTRPGEEPSLIVESVQSVANHLESTTWSEAERRPVDALANLPWVRVTAADGAYLTSSREEPHRLASPYVRQAQVNGSSGTDWLCGRLGLAKDRPLDRPQIHAAIFAIDPLCLIHGVFFSEKAFTGNPKVRRAIHGVIEAHDVRPAVSGGVKRDDVRFSVSAGSGAEEGYGFVPFSRTEYTARQIVLSAAIDLEQLRNYQLGTDATRLLGLVALWELAALLAAPMRLRTACDLQVTSVAVRSPVQLALPGLDELTAELAGAATAVGFTEPLVIDAKRTD